MTHDKQSFLRLAAAIHQQLSAQQSVAHLSPPPTADWRQCERLWHRLQRARQRGWHLAANRIQRDLTISIQRLQSELTDRLSQCRKPSNDPPVASLADIQADLLALQEEFEQVTFSRRDRTLTVTTEPLELEEVYLGPFKIRLEWGKLSTECFQPYQVIAVDPNPAVSNEGVTHPHVQNEAVCEGDGRQPIQRALEQGRLLDFFLIVANLLRTYNDSSPYVSLSDWYGVACTDCGTNVCDDERWICERCGVSVCGDCYVGCCNCDRIYCSACVTCCPACDESHCRSCAKECADCQATLCISCHQDNERCPDCHEAKEIQTDTAEPATIGDEGESVPTVQSHCLGEAAISA